jgi:hypothetical protein
MWLILKILIIFNSLSFSQDINEYKKKMQQALQLQDQINSQRDIRIERISGNVKVISAEGEEKDLKNNYQYPLESGDIIKTGYDGSAMIYIDNIAAMKLDRNSEFEITDNSNEPVFSLNFGSLISKVEKFVKKKIQFKIKTIQAVCAIRGTEFAVEHSKLSGESIFAVFDEGELSIFPIDAEDDETKAIKLLKNSEVVFSNQTKNRRVTKISRMSRYRNNFMDIRKRFLSHKKNWKRFTNEQRIKYRNLLFMKKNELNSKNKNKNIKRVGNNRKHIEK